MLPVIYRLQSETSFLASFVPILFSHVVVPPISFLLGQEVEPHPLFEDLYAIFPFTRDFVLENLLLCPSRHKFPADYQYITHMFVHGSYAHMFGNLYTAFICGRSVHMELGAAGMYCLYLSGGIIASLPSLLSLSNQKFMDAAIKDTFTLREKASYLPGFLKTAWNTVVPPIGQAIVKSTLPMYVCGSSGATCALLGASILFTLKDIVHSPLLQNLLTRRRDPQSRTELGPIIALQPVFTQKFLGSVYTLLTSVGYLVSEYNLMHPETGGGNSFRQNLFNILEQARIGHVAHMQGALYGAGFAATFGFILPYLSRLKNDWERGGRGQSTTRSFFV